jgi:hypothetical protein
MANETNLQGPAYGFLMLVKVTLCIRSKIEAAQSAALTSIALSKACQYALALWKKLTRFLEYPELELSTNLAENSMRPVALGRNYVHSRIMCSRPVPAVSPTMNSLHLSGRRMYAQILPR